MYSNFLSYLMQGEDGCILIDTSETYEMAREVKQVFEEQFGLGTPTKPIKAIILTHFHPDHTFGFDVFKVKQYRSISLFQAYSSLIS